MKTARRLALALVAAAALVTGSTVLATAGNQHLSGKHAPAHPRSSSRPLGTIGFCTMAVPSTDATVEVRIPDAADFCELVSEGLSADVFHTTVLVTAGRLWHYADAPLSCRLGYRDTLEHITIHNSASACHWLTLPRTNWHREPMTAEAP